MIGRKREELRMGERKRVRHCQNIISHVDDNRAHFYITGSSIEHYYNTEQYDAVRYIVQHRVIE